MREKHDYDGESRAREQKCGLEVCVSYETSLRPEFARMLTRRARCCSKTQANTPRAEWAVRSAFLDRTPGFTPNSPFMVAMVSRPASTRPAGCGCV